MQFTHLKVDEVVGHLKKGKTGRFAKTVFHFLKADKNNSCTAAIVKEKPVNLGDGEGMQVPCALLTSMERKCLSKSYNNSY